MNNDNLPLSLKKNLSVINQFDNFKIKTNLIIQNLKRIFPWSDINKIISKIFNYPIDSNFTKYENNLIKQEGLDTVFFSQKGGNIRILASQNDSTLPFLGNMEYNNDYKIIHPYTLKYHSLKLKKGLKLYKNYEEML